MKLESEVHKAGQNLVRNSSVISIRNRSAKLLNCVKNPWKRKKNVTGKCVCYLFTTIVDTVVLFYFTMASKCTLYNLHARF